MSIVVDHLPGTVCSQTEKVNELQASIHAVRRGVDVLRNAPKLHDSIKSMHDNSTT